MKNAYLWIGTAVIVILIGGYYFIAQTQNKSNESTTLPQVTTTPAATSTNQEKNIVEAENQPASTIIVTGQVRSEKSGFIAIHVDTNQAPGAVIGNSELFPSGENRNVVVNLTKSLKPGDVVYAMLHTDANSNGVYEFPGDDAPIKDSKGNIVMAKITAQ